MFLSHVSCILWSNIPANMICYDFACELFIKLLLIPIIYDLIVKLVLDTYAIFGRIWPTGYY